MFLIYPPVRALQACVNNYFFTTNDRNKPDSKAAAVWGLHKGALEVLGNQVLARIFPRNAYVLIAAAIPLSLGINFGAGLLATEISQRKVYNPLTNSMIDNPLSYVLNDSWFSKPVTKENTNTLVISELIEEVIVSSFLALAFTASVVARAGLLRNDF